MDLPRQPQPVRIELSGDQRDIDHVVERMMRVLTSGWNSIERNGNVIVYYPAAVND